MKKSFLTGKEELPWLNTELRTQFESCPRGLCCAQCRGNWGNGAESSASVSGSECTSPLSLCQAASAGTIRGEKGEMGYFCLWPWCRAPHQLACWRSSSAHRQDTGPAPAAPAANPAAEPRARFTIRFCSGGSRPQHIPARVSSTALALDAAAAASPWRGGWHSQDAWSDRAKTLIWLPQGM